MKKNTKIMMTILSGLACGASITAIIRRNKSQKRKMLELLDNTKRYEEYSGTDDFHYRDVISRNAEGKWVLKSNVYSDETVTSHIRELTEDELTNFVKFLWKAIRKNTIDIGDKEFQNYTKVTLADGTEYAFDAFQVSFLDETV